MVTSALGSLQQPLSLGTFCVYMYYASEARYVVIKSMIITRSINGYISLQHVFHSNFL
jgi:hypothetical protein